MHQFLERACQLFPNLCLVTLSVFLFNDTHCFKSIWNSLMICPCLEGAGGLKFRMVVTDVTK